MTNSIEMEIVRLVQEIAEDEKTIRELKTTIVDLPSLRYLNEVNIKKIEMHEESLSRKMKLLEILRG